MLDPRIESNAEEIKKIKDAIIILANNLDGIAWRVSTEEERRAGIAIAEKIRKLLSK